MSTPRRCEERSHAERDVLGRRRDAEELAVVAAHDAELRRDHDASRARRAIGAAEQLLVVTARTCRRCRRRSRRARARGAACAIASASSRGAVELRHAHAAEAERSRFESVATDAALVVESHPSHYRIGLMAQAHGDRLTAVDASFLAQEGRASHMHVGAVMIFDGPPPAFEDFATTSARGCTSSRATARSSPSRRSRPAGRSGSTTRASTSSTTSATPRCRRPAREEQLRALVARDATPSSSTARSRCGRCGSSRASRATASR